MLPDSEDLEGPRLWIVIGLGNPGDEYAETYHNVGFRVVEILADRGGASNWSRPDSIGMIPARIAEIVAGQAGPNAILVQPWTYMNRTGEILAPLFDRFSPDARLLVVSDDLALPLGKIRLRQRGSAGGHNGLKSVGSAYGSDQYCRIRVGIDAGRPQGDTRDYVLSRVRKPDRETLGRAEALAADAVEAVISESVPLAMSRFNGIDLREPEDGKT
jgi:PTH1 family peptidyl-tRNA hydrolase